MELSLKLVDGVFVCSLSGDAQLSLVADALDLMLADARWRPATPFVHDISSLNTARLNVEDIRKISLLAAQRRAEIGPAKIAVVVADDLDFGSARMLGVYLGEALQSEVGVYRDLQSAVEWVSGPVSD